MTVEAGIKPGTLEFIPGLKSVGAIGKHSDSNVSLLRMRLTPKPPIARFQSLAFTGEKIEEQLKDAIIAMMDGICSTNSSAFDFELSEATVELEFQIVTEGNLAIVVVDEGIQYAQKHKLILKLKRQ